MPMLDERQTVTAQREQWIEGGTDFLGNCGGRLMPFRSTQSLMRSAS